MKCKNGKDNMWLNEDECMWHCPHCGYEKFARRRFFNEMVKQAKDYKSKEEFVSTFAECVSDIISRAWDKYSLEERVEEDIINQRIKEDPDLHEKE